MATSSSSSSSSYTLEMTIRSAESLTIAGKMPKNLFVTISPEDDQSHYLKQQRTKVCQDDESCHPAWNEKFTMDVPMHVQFVVLEVHCSTWSGDKIVGVAKVPVSDFVGNSTPLNYLHFLSYRLRDGNGDPNGIVNFSVKILKGLDIKYSGHSNYYNAGYMGSADIKGFGYGNNRGNCVPKHTQPWQPTPSVGYPRNSSAAAVGVPAAWYNSSHL